MFDKLKSEMEKHGIRTNKLAKLANITPSDLYAALNGDKRMFPNWKKRIADVLNMTESELFDESASVKEAENEK